MKKLIYIFALIVVLSACSQHTDDKSKIITPTNPAKSEKEASGSTVKKVLSKDEYASLKVNELGEIPVLMYHALVTSNPPSSYQRTIEGFKADLNYLYNNKYRLISMKDYVASNINVEAGYTPVVLTFDDGEPSDFSLIDSNGKLIPTPDCAVDILEKFNAEHPGFGKSAIFNINGGESQFEGAGTYADRLNYLVNNGYEIGYHTYNHPNLSKISAEKLQEEIGKQNAQIKAALPNYVVNTLAYPFGVRPSDDEIKKLVLDGVYKGEKYHVDIAFREGPSVPKLLPTIHAKFDSLNAPRLRGNDDEKTGADMGGYMKAYEKKPERRYISDGDASTIVVPVAEEVNVAKDRLGDKKVVTY